MRATKLTHEEIQLAEVAFIKLGDDRMRLLDAVESWLKDGKQKHVAESPRIDEAVTAFSEWLDSKDCELRDRTRSHLRLRVNIFANGIGNLRVDDVTPQTIYSYLEKRNVVKASKDNDRRAICRFFSWCMAFPREWLTLNPARKQVRERRTEH